MRYFCTYFDRNYLIKGLALIDSLGRHEKKSFQIFVVCLDEITRTILDRLSLPNVKTIPLHEIEQRDYSLLAAKNNRSLIEYYWTLTTTILLRILEKNPEIDLLTYLDADLFFYSSSDPIFDELGDQSILIHEHRFSPEQAFLERFGKYNVGLLCFRNDLYGIEALKWWRDRCIEWCYARFEDGKYGDQLYLNDWLTRFEKVVVLKNIGAGVGPWNHIQYDFSLDDVDNNVLINEVPLVFYHFHSLVFVQPHVVIPSKYITNPLTKDILRMCFLPYVRCLSECVKMVRSVSPDFVFGLVENNVLTIKHTFLASSDLESSMNKQRLPQGNIALEDGWDCYCSPQLRDFAELIESINALQRANEFEKASAALTMAMEEYPGSADLKVIEGELEVLRGNKDGARKHFEKMIERWPQYYMAYNNLGVLLWEVGEVGQALERLKYAISMNPYELDVVLNFAGILSDTEQYVEAEKVLRQYLRVDKNNQEVKNLLRSVLEHKGTDVSSHDTGNKPTQETLNPLIDAAEHIQAGRISEAEEICQRFLSTHPDDAGVFHVLAIIAHKKGNSADAVNLVRRAIDNSGDSNEIAGYIDFLEFVQREQGG